MDNGSFEVPPLRADGQGRHISENPIVAGVARDRIPERKTT